MSRYNTITVMALKSNIFTSSGKKNKKDNRRSSRLKNAKQKSYSEFKKNT